MKRTFATMALAFGLGSLFMASPASAQSNPAVADIPFAFQASGVTLPAGHYNISQFSHTSPTFTLRNRDGRSIFTYLGVMNEGRPQNPSLTFLHTGNDYVLAKITPPDSRISYSLPEKDRPAKMRLAAVITIALK